MMKWLLCAALTAFAVPAAAQQATSLGGLPAVSVVNPTDTLPITQGYTGPGTGVTRKVTVTQLGLGAGGNASNATVAVPGTTDDITLATWAGEVVDAKRFGVKCDGTTDDTAALQAFLNYVSANYRTLGVLPAGTCLFSSGLTFTPQFSGMTGRGWYATTLLYTGTNTTTDLLKVGNLTNEYGSAQIGNFDISSTTTMTAGAALHVQNMVSSVFSGITTDIAGTYNQKLYNGVWFDEVEFVTFEHFNIESSQNDGVELSAPGFGPGKPQGDFFAEFGIIGQNTGAGVHIGGGFDMSRWDNIEVTTNGTNVLVDNALEAYKNQEIEFGSGFVTDQAQTGDNYYINDTLANQVDYCNINILGVVTASKTASGIHVKSWPSCFINIKSPYLYNNNGAGLKVDDASTYILMDPSTLIFRNGQDGASYGVQATFATSNILSLGQVFGNNGRDINANVQGVQVTPQVVVSAKPLPPTISTTGSTTITAAQMLSGVVFRGSCSAAVSDATDTAANIVAAMGGVAAGEGFDFTIMNICSYADTPTAGTGVTLSATTSLNAASSRRYRATVTAVSPAAVTITGLESGGV